MLIWGDILVLNNNDISGSLQSNLRGYVDYV